MWHGLDVRIAWAAAEAFTGVNDPTERGSQGDQATDTVIPAAVQHRART